MNFVPVELTHKPIFASYLAGRSYRLITYSFTNAWLWRHWDAYTWCVAEDALCLRTGFGGGDAVLCPISPDDRAVFAATERLIDLFRDQGRDFFMVEVDEDMLARFEQRWPGRFAATEFPPGGNYIYRQEDLAQLKGKKYDGKRNMLHRFEREHPQARFVPLSEALIPACRTELDSWYAYQDLTDANVRLEYAGCADALQHLSALGCIGGALLLDERVVAFTLGEPLSPDTFCVHIEKADATITGAYQTINHLFARECCAGYEFINRAEDMGEPGLRRAKQSYHPCCIAKKYSLRLR